MTHATSSLPHWWEPRAFEIGEARRWRIGPATVRAERRARAWHVLYHAGTDPLDDTLTIAEPVRRDEPVDAGASLSRYAFARTPGRLALEPRLADRPMIVRPVEPMVVAAHERTQLYVSTPVWLAVTTLGPRHLLGELPSYRPSDTWFGPNTVEGELCYATRTSGRSDLGSLPVRPHRAITPVQIEESSGAPLKLERIRVPVGLLALYVSDRGLWTPRLTLLRSAGGDVAEIRIDRDAPPEARGATRIAEPRLRSEGMVTLRTFTRLLGLGGAS